MRFVEFVIALQGSGDLECFEKGVADARVFAEDEVARAQDIERT